MTGSVRTPISSSLGISWQGPVEWPRNHGHRIPYQTRIDRESWEIRTTYTSSRPERGRGVAQQQSIKPAIIQGARWRDSFAVAVVVVGIRDLDPATLGLGACWLMPVRGDPSIWLICMNEVRYLLVVDRRLVLGFVLDIRINQPAPEQSPGMASLVLMPYYIDVIASGCNIDQWVAAPALLSYRGLRH